MFDLKKNAVRRGFTLIELLVVIAIITLLLAIIMPALGKVKAVAKRTVCNTNIRQNGLAFHLHAADNDGEFFIAPGDNLHSSFYGWGGVTLDWEYAGYLNAAGYNIANRPYERALNTYLPTETPVYICPSDPSGDSKLWAPFGDYNGVKDPTKAEDSTQAYYTSTGTSFQYNAYLVKTSGYTKMSQVQSGGNTILINEWPAYDVLTPLVRPDWWTDEPRWSFHDNSGRGVDPRELNFATLTDQDTFGNNTCFVDGHVDYVEYVANKPCANGYRWYKQ